MLLGLSFLLAPGGAAAQEVPPDRTGVVIQLRRPARIAPGERATTVAVLGDDAIIQGTVEQDLIVAGGRAEVTGAVEGNVVVIDGALDLGPGARVGRDVTLVRSEMAQGPGATVGGAVHRTTGAAWSWGVAWLFWLSTTLFVIAAGLLFAAIGGRQLSGAGSVLVHRPGGSVLMALLLWIALPLLSFAAFFTIIGAPLGLGVLVFVLPALWFLGYLVAGAALGGLIAGRRRSLAYLAHPYAAVALGLLLLQLVGFIPWIGAALAALAGFVGAGALALRSWRLGRGESAGGAPIIPTAAPPRPA